MGASKPGGCHQLCLTVSRKPAVDVDSNGDSNRRERNHPVRDDGVPQVVQPDLGAAGFLSKAGEVSVEVASRRGGPDGSPLVQGRADGTR